VDENKELDRTLQDFSKIAKTGVVWFKVSSLSANSKRKFLMLYGNQMADVPPADGAKVFIEYDLGAIGLWHLDEGSGSAVYDETGNNLDGTITGATWTTGKFKNALSFDGNDYVNFGKVLHNFVGDTSKITVISWIKISTTHTGAIVGNTIAGNAEVVFDVEVNRPRLGLYTTYNWKSVVGPTLDNDKWYHVVGTYDGAYILIYINGTKKASVSHIGSITLQKNEQNLMIGDRADFSRPFYGVIDEVAILSKALTKSQVSNVYNNYLDQADKTVVRKYVSPEPGVSLRWT